MATSSIVPSNQNDDRCQIFYFDDCPIRIVTDDSGAPWFVVADVCRALDLGNPTRAIERLDDDEKTLTSIQGNTNQANIISESGLYSLILTSRKEAAKKFKRWVTHDVLPSIRKTGQYAIQELSPARALLAAVQQLVDHEERISALERKTDRIVDENDDLSEQVEYWRDQSDINFGVKRRPWRS